MATNRLNLSRDQLSTFLKTHEQIKQFERLFAQVSEVDPIVLQSVLSLANVADSKAQQAMDMHDRQDYIDFAFNAPFAESERRLAWNNTEQSLQIGMENGLPLHIGKDIVYYGKNTGASAISKGMAVMANGVVGASGKITFERAVADGSVNQMYMIGIAAQDIAVGEFGYIQEFGLISNLDTAAWNEGDVLYFDDATPGDLTITEPTAPSLKIPCAIVLRDNANTGQIFVRMHNGYRLQDIHDVYAPSPADGDVLVWEAVNGRWEPSTYNGSNGPFTPTITNGTNVASSTARLCRMIMMGNIVCCSGHVTIDPTAAVQTDWYMSLPIPSNFTDVYDASGSFTSLSGTGITGIIFADTVNDRLKFDGIAALIAAQDIGFNAMYTLK